MVIKIKMLTMRVDHLPSCTRRCSLTNPENTRCPSDSSGLEMESLSMSGTSKGLRLAVY